MLKGPLSRWNYNSFCNVNKKLNAREMELKKLDVKGDATKLNEVELARIKTVKVECKICRREAQLMRQYSRVKNLIERDNKTRYFHTLASFNKKNNMMARVVIEGEVLSNVIEMRRGIRIFIFQSYTQKKLPEFELPMGVFKRFNNVTSAMMGELMDAKEIEKAMLSCGTSKVPGYDGINLKFIR